MQYLPENTIESFRTTATPRWGMTAMGYTQRRGAPTPRLVRLRGEKRWRRLMVWQFSNAGTLFVRVEGQPLIVREWEHAALA